MRLHDLVEAYIAFKRSLGMRFRSQSALLRAYSRAMGDVAVEEVRPEAVLVFITGRGPVTTRWMDCYGVLAGFYCYAITRGFATMSPLPVDTPKHPPPFIPYVYTVDELKRLVAATDILETPLSPLLAVTMRSPLLLLYGTGMRIGEALSLTLKDVDLESRVLTVRDAKFFKTRVVPIGTRLAMVLSDYLSRRRQLPFPVGSDSAFLATRTGLHLDYKRVNKLFCRLRRVAKIQRESTARYQPRIHDIRHATAVHRIIAWYRAGADVQRLLPQLATYLGHVDMRSTQQYLSMTAELLQEASLRFERYAQPEVRHA
ncbi:Tyrosine recombinase XerC [Paraburkholderia nemoris]|nr:tyrosine-type recombinase/integrase [Paraburkholderia aspalathi]CAE6851819.1 Tyrosine recombinase XerC [Paraburkholderia nemoris]